MTAAELIAWGIIGFLATGVFSALLAGRIARHCARQGTPKELQPEEEWRARSERWKRRTLTAEQFRDGYRQQRNQAWRKIGEQERTIDRLLLDLAAWKSHAENAQSNDTESMSKLGEVMDERLQWKERAERATAGRAALVAELDRLKAAEISVEDAAGNWGHFFKLNELSSSPRWALGSGSTFKVSLRK